MKKLLLIVDVQKHFIPKDQTGKEFCEKVEKLQHSYENIAFSRFINTPDSFFVTYLKWKDMMEGDDGNKIAITPAENAFIFNTDTYSSVSDQFLDYLDKNKIEEVHIAGVDADACILATAFRLWDKKIHFKILMDHCISTAGENIESSAHHLMNKNFGFDIVINQKEAINQS